MAIGFKLDLERPDLRSAQVSDLSLEFDPVFSLFKLSVDSDRDLCSGLARRLGAARAGQPVGR